MTVYIPLAFLTALICYCCRNSEYRAKRAFFFSMFAACLVLAIRFEFGPDYMNYYDVFNGVSGSDVESYTGKGSSEEIVFLSFLSLFPSFTSFVIFMTLSLFLVNSFFIFKYVKPQFFWIVVFFMFLEPTFLLLELVAFRAAIGAVLFLIAFFFLLKRKRLVYIALVLLASLFHTSCFLLLVFALFSTNQKSLLFSQWVPAVCLVLALFTVLLGDNFIMTSLVDYAIDTVEELNRYEGYVETLGGVGQSLFTIIYRIMAFVILLYLALSGRKEKDPQYVLIYKIAVAVAILQLVFGQSLISDRYQMVLNIVYICAIARSLSFKQVIDHRVVLVFIGAISLYMLYSKMGKVYNASYLVYHTIFDAPFIP